MTLLRQIMLVVIAIFILLFSANFVLTVYDSRLYLEEQMRVHAQDTATSLGVSMTTALAEGDDVSLELLANAVFDRGYYREILLLDLDNKILLERHNPVSTDDVPHWFTSLIELPSPVGRSEITNGWNMLGELRVVAHPGPAYRDLWRITVDYFYLFIFITIVSYAVLGLVLKIIMSPLLLVEQQANDICDRKFPILETMPKTRELRRVVEAMNRMSAKVKEMFNRQVQLTESLREEARTDPVTGLINRREFDAQVTSILSSEQGPGPSTLMILQIRNFAGLNTSLGRVGADELLNQVAQRIFEHLGSKNEALISRRSGSEFAIYIPRITLERARVYLETTFRAVASLQIFIEDENLDAVHMGGSFHEHTANLPLMLSSADTALRSAQTDGNNGTYFLIYGDSSNPVSDLIKQAGEWKATLERAIEEENVIFHYQPIYHLPNRDLFAYEIFVRLEIDGKIVNAGVFMPMAERFDMLVQLDKLIITRAFRELTDDSPNFVINLSTRSLQDDEFVDWLDKKFEEFKHYAEKIIFEMHEISVHLAYDQVKHMVDTANKYGFRFSVDHFGSSATAFSYLQSLDVHFIKIDRSFVTNISENTDNQFFIQSVAQIAHTRDMALIAEGVELDSELETLMDLKVDAVMGYLLGRPDSHYE